jgi:hypothetical protein
MLGTLRVKFVRLGNALLSDSLHVLRKASVLEELLSLAECLCSELLVHGLYPVTGGGVLPQDAHSADRCALQYNIVLCDITPT